jgi:hypothetical protein
MFKSKQSPEQLKWHQRALLATLSLFIRLWGRTLRYHWDTDVQDMMDDEMPPAVMIIWHNRLLAGTAFYLRHLQERRLATLISASKDGAWLAGFVENLGVRTVRGSRFNRGAQAVRDMITASNEGFDIGVTPDGSRGPLYDMKPGALRVALKTGAPIILLSLNHTSAWRLKTWDRFYIPHPFSKVEVRMDVVSLDEVSGLEVEEATALLKARMDAITVDFF